MNAPSASSASTIPVYKVGGILLRGLDTPSPEVLIAQPRPKHDTPHDLPPMGLPRGTRKYWTKKETLSPKEWHDARDAHTAQANAKNLEPLTNTLQSELHEEVGIKPEWLRKQPVYDMGTHLFPSLTKVPYMVQWYVITPNEATQQKMTTEPLKDSEKTEWVSVAELTRRAALPRGTQDYVNPAYVPLVQMAMEKMQKNELPLVKSIPKLPESASKA